MSFDSLNASELKYFNFTAPIPYRLIFNNEEDVRVRVVTNQFTVYEKKTFNQHARYPFLVKIEVNDATELNSLKAGVENAIGQQADLLCCNTLYVNANKEIYEALKTVSIGETVAFDIRLRHVVYFAANPRIKFVLDSFILVPLVAEKPVQKTTKKLKRQNAIDPEMQEGSSGMIDNFLASLREEAN